jgi:DNA-binding XRE family transcriptional regulator
MKGNFKTDTQRDRLELLVIHLKTTLSDLAKLVGLNKNTLYHVGSGKRGEMSDRTATRICYSLKKKRGVTVNKQWLLTGEGEMIIEELPPKTIEAKIVEKTTEQDIDWREKYCSLLEEFVKLQERHIALLEKNK